MDTKLDQVDSLDADLAAFLRQRALEIPVVELTDLPVVEARVLYERRVAYGQNGDYAQCLTQDVQPAGAPAARIYRPSAPLGAETILYVHGGGWIFGNLDTHDWMMRALCTSARATVVAIDYRLAPESRYPAQLADCLAAYRWLRQSADALGVDAGAITLAGDSAGACIALSTAQELLRQRAKMPAALILLYGCYAPDFSTVSHDAYGDGRFGLSSAAMRRFWKYYAGEHPPRQAAPLRGEFYGLPPIYLGAAGLDPLLDDTLRLAEALATAGVPYHLDRWPACPHAFLQLPVEIPVVGEAFKDIATGWRGLLEDGTS